MTGTPQSKSGEISVDCLLRLAILKNFKVINFIVPATNYESTYYLLLTPSDVQTTSVCKKWYM